MATSKDRGTKRTCQNGDCGARFYDLNRNPITCPICGSGYVIASSPIAIAAVAAEEKAPRKPKKEELVDEATPEAEAEGEDDLDVDADDSSDDADETFLEEEEEDGGDVTNIIGPVDGEDET